MNRETEHLGEPAPEIRYEDDDPGAVISFVVFAAGLAVGFLLWEVLNFIAGARP